jgi:hypothetical protein
MEGQKHRGEKGKNGLASNRGVQYYELLKDPRWQKKRLEILERDHWTCQICGEKDSMLVVHHLCYRQTLTDDCKKERRLYPWEYDNYELITLCDGCNSEEHESAEYWIDEIGQVLKHIGFNSKTLCDLQEVFFNLYYLYRAGSEPSVSCYKTNYVEPKDKNDIPRIIINKMIKNVLGVE